MTQQTLEKPKEIKEEVKRLAIVLAVVIVAGGMLYKYDSAGQNSQTSNQNNQPNMNEAKKENFTITDPNLQIKPPTEEEIKSFDALAETKIVVLETSKGKIKVKLAPKDAPLTVASFMKLVDKGLYNGLIFHRVISDFMIQGGDPSGNGTGGPGYQFIDELNPETQSYKDGYAKGVLAMANSGPDTNGSQFFIMLKDTPLPHNYTIFGKVVAGQEVVDAIGKVATYQGAETETKKKDMPLAPIKINKIVLEDAK